MNIVSKPTNGLTGLAHLVRLRALAESYGVVFNDLTLEMETEQAKTCMENLDLCGNVTQEMFVRFLAIVISVTDYEVPDASMKDSDGHRWLHTWLETSGIGGGCDTALEHALQFGKVLQSSVSLEEAKLNARLGISDMLDLEKMAAGIGDTIAQAFETALERAPRGERPGIEADLVRLLAAMGDIFVQYATPENNFIKVKEVCSSLAPMVPYHALGTFVSNAILAINWGLVGPGLMDALRGDQVLGDKLKFSAQQVSREEFEKMRGSQARGKGGFDQDTLDAFKSFWDDNGDDE